MIMAAGLGTRLQPLTHWRPKPVVPVRGIPLLAYPLALLGKAGVTEVVINTHHLPEVLEEAAAGWSPDGLQVHFSGEAELLHTGGGIRRVADFLRESDHCVILGGDMVVDLDLAGLIRRHANSGRAVTMALTEDPRAGEFGTIGLDGNGRLRRISRRIDWGHEEQSGVYTWVNVLSRRAFDTVPDREAFNHLDEWWAPAAAEEPNHVGGEVLPASALQWQPVGTMAEYLDANLKPFELSYLDVEAAATAAGARLTPGLVIGAGATVPADARLSEVVVWDGETVPAGTRATRGVFAGGAFHPVEPAA